MAFPLTDVIKYYFYRRYKWSHTDFGILQDTLLNFAATLSAKGYGNAVLAGLRDNGGTGLAVGYTSGFAVNDLGHLLGVNSNGTVNVTDNVMSLIVIRPTVQDTNTINRPTSPFDPVPLNSEQTANVVALAGTLSAYPSTASGDVVLFGVTAGGGVITNVDRSQCQLQGKTTDNTDVFRVGLQRDCHFQNLASAMAVASANQKFRVKSNEALTTPVTVTVANIDIEFAPGVVFQDAGAGTGLNLTANGTRVLYGRFAGFTTEAIKMSGAANYCSVIGTRFASSNANDVNDTVGTSQTVGVINE